MHVSVKTSLIFAKLLPTKMERKFTRMNGMRRGRLQNNRNRAAKTSQTLAEGIVKVARESVEMCKTGRKNDSGYYDQTPINDASPV